MRKIVPKLSASTTCYLESLPCFMYLTIFLYYLILWSVVTVICCECRDLGHVEVSVWRTAITPLIFSTPNFQYLDSTIFDC